ncbi:hypothetical protein F4775DRAFT_586652 [Biscogniauxia sp. FL1348]|nr:hypothetical protein F4775DRAFT_586652 [Biscogniauxia sp. FL1348]
MIVKPLAGKDEDIFINPVDVVQHQCDIRPPPLDDTMLTTNFFQTSTMIKCHVHTCCGDVDVFDCQLFTSSNEDITYESVMAPPEPGTPEAAAVAAGQVTPPSWTADIKKYPHQFYIANWIEVQDTALDHDMLKTEEGKLEDLAMTVKSAKELASMAASVATIAIELNKKSHLAINSAHLWQPKDDGPLLGDLERVVKQWEILINTWTQLNFGSNLREGFQVSEIGTVMKSIHGIWLYRRPSMG